VSSGRRWVVYGLIAAVLGGNLVSFVFNRQLWPYSQYPMFAEARGRTFETLVLVGEPVEGGEIWFESQGYLTDQLSPMVINTAFGGPRPSRHEHRPAILMRLLQTARKRSSPSCSIRWPSSSAPPA